MSKENLADREWQLRYCTSSLNDNGEPTDILHDFYIPALKRATSYDRVAGYFRSTSLAAASQGYTAFLNNGGHMRMIVGADLQVQDVAVILAGNRQRLSDTLMQELDKPETWPEDVQNGVALLGAMVASEQLEVKVAFRVNAVTKEPISVDATDDGYVHEKWFIMGDGENRLYGSGSLNESRTALTLNAENIDINCDWEGKRDKQRVERADRDFQLLWDGKNPHMRVMEIPEAVKERLVHIKNLKGRPTEIDGTVLKEDVKLTPMDVLRFAVLKDAPKMPRGIYIGMYSAPVEPWPHQEIVSRRLIESWPYSYMMCDEVGLGKTIEAALAMRSLILSGRAKRVLIIAPKSLTSQWHRELAQKAMLPFYKSQAKPGLPNRAEHVKIYPSEEGSYTDNNLYTPDFNIISSGLVSRKERREMLQKADKCDIILVDEAHYARRQNPRENSAGAPKYGQLYKTLQDDVKDKAPALWLATATPMQIDPIEVYDLYKLCGRSGAFMVDPTLGMNYFELTGKIARDLDLNNMEWSMLGQSFAQIEALDPYLWDIIRETTVNGKNRRVLKQLRWEEPMRADVKYLKRPLFAASPLSRVMMRHNRKLLEIYRQHGELKSNLARRNVLPICAIEFTPEEAAFYNLLEAYCKELNNQIRQNNPQARQIMVFLLNFLQLRFASSIYAIQQTLIRRLKKVKASIKMGAKTFHSKEELEEALRELEADSTVGNEEYNEGDLDEITIEALLKDRSMDDLKWEESALETMLSNLDGIHETPSKIQRLLKEIDRRRSGGRVRQTVLFTRFYDSLYSIRQYLATRDPGLRVGVYSGEHAIWYDPERKEDVSTTHEEIKSLFIKGNIDILLCTDAAAEGLNLQTADMLINFDLGWNPMKIEQRIGRIDRIGQKYEDIYVMNMCYLGSTEEKVYGRLFARLSKAGLVVGTQQISMLPVSVEEFRKLENNEITLEELEKESKKRLKEQQKATAAMEISAEDLYDMYRKQSAAMKEMELPADVEDLHDALTEAKFLKDAGLIVKDNIINVPEFNDVSGFIGTTNRALASDDYAYVTWGNPSVDGFLNAVGTASDEIKCFRRIAYKAENAEYIGYAVAADNGVKLIVSYKQLKDIALQIDHKITDDEADTCLKELKRITEQDLSEAKKREDAIHDNQAFARLHDKMLHNAAVFILDDLEVHGMIKISDAIKQLENNKKKMYYVPLSHEEFFGKTLMLLFPAVELNGQVQITVRGMLLESVIELIVRCVNGIKKRRAEITTAEVIRRLKR